MKFNESFFEEEVKCGFTITSKQKRIWADELLLLEKFTEICSRHNIKFFASGGTLLGAVRHKGFIPWDDDIDLRVLRPDYEKLKTLACEFTEPFELQFLSDDCQNWCGGYMKLRNSNSTACAINRVGDNFNGGGFIDIFPADGVFEDPKRRAEQVKEIEYFRKLLIAKVYGKNYWSLTFTTDGEFEELKNSAAQYSDKEAIELFEKACMQCNCEDAEMVTPFAFEIENEKFFQHKEDFEQIVYLDFEGLKIPAPKNYDRYLSVMFGDYMKFPAVEERKSMHIKTVFDPDTPYKQYDFSKFLKVFSDIKPDEKIWIFGNGTFIDDYFKRYGDKYSPELILDNDMQNWGTTLTGVAVVNPDEALAKKYNYKIRIIVCGPNTLKISEGLENIGVKNHYVYLQNRKYDY